MYLFRASSENVKSSGRVEKKVSCIGRLYEPKDTMFHLQRITNKSKFRKMNKKLLGSKENTILVRYNCFTFCMVVGNNFGFLCLSAVFTTLI